MDASHDHLATEGPARPGGRTSRARKARHLVGAAVGATALLASVVASDAASASPAAPTSDAVVAATPVPSCVHVYSWFSELFQYVGIDNNCSSTQRAKVIVSGGPDSQCYSIPRGGHVEFRVLWGDFDTVVRC